MTVLPLPAARFSSLPYLLAVIVTLYRKGSNKTKPKHAIGFTLPRPYRQVSFHRIVCIMDVNVQCGPEYF